MTTHFCNDPTHDAPDYVDPVAHAFGHGWGHGFLEAGRPRSNPNGTMEDALARSSDEVSRLVRENQRLRARLDAARHVAVYWRDGLLEEHRKGWRFAAIGTHPLAAVIEALDTDPESETFEALLLRVAAK